MVNSIEQSKSIA